MDLNNPLVKLRRGVQLVDVVYSCGHAGSRKAAQHISEAALRQIRREAQGVLCPLCSRSAVQRNKAKESADYLSRQRQLMDTDAPSTPPEITVLLVNDSERFMRALKAFLTDQHHLKVIGTAKGGAEVVQLIHQQGQPRVVLLDLHMPARSGLEMIPMLREIVPAAYIILLTVETAPHIKGAALAAGANAYVLKDKLTEELVPAILRCSVI